MIDLFGTNMCFGEGSEAGSAWIFLRTNERVHGGQGEKKELVVAPPWTTAKSV